MKMKSQHCFMILLIYLTTGTLQENQQLVGSVTNYQPAWDPNVTDQVNMLGNAEAYCAFITEAAKRSSDLIVFPADGLNGGTKVKKTFYTFPELAENFNLSKQNYSNQILALISRCTQTARIYTVLTVDAILDKKNCTIQIVFNRNGTIIARFLFSPFHDRNQGIRCRNNSDYNEEIFSTDKGHRVGLLLNDDLYLQQRTDRMKHKLNVTYFALSYDLLDSPPFATGIQTEWWWSYKENRALLAAGLTEPGRSGSGLYIGRKVGLPKIYNHCRRGDAMLTRFLPNITDFNVSTTDPYIPLSWEEPEMDRIQRMQEWITLNRRTRSSASAKAEASAEAYVSVDKRDIHEPIFVQEDNLDNYTRLPVSVHYLGEHEFAGAQRLFVDERLCNTDLCCRFKMKWNLRLTSTEDLTDNNEIFNNSSELNPKTVNKGLPGCYLIVVGNTEDILGDNGNAHVKRCALVYTKTTKYCIKPSTSPPLFRNQNASHGLHQTMHHQLLHRSNSKLQILDIIVNQQGLTPNILTANYNQPIPSAKTFVYNDEPVSRLYVKKSFSKPITLGLQRIDSYKLIR